MSLRHRLQRVLKLALLANRGPRFLRHVLAAHRARAVRRINLDRVRQPHDLAVQALVHHLGHHLWRVTFAASEIGPADITDEQRVAGENFLWFVRDFSVGDEYADAFGRVARSFHEAQAYFAEFDLLAVANGTMCESGVGFRAE